MTAFYNIFLLLRISQLKLQGTFKDHHLLEKASVRTDISHGLDLSNRCH